MHIDCLINSCQMCPAREARNHKEREVVKALIGATVGWHNGLDFGSLTDTELHSMIEDESSISANLHTVSFSVKDLAVKSIRYATENGCLSDRLSQSSVKLI